MRSLIVITSLLAAVGCGGASDVPPLAPVTGKVILDGKPTGGLTVQFIPDNEQGTTGPASSGISNVEGYFELFTPAGEKGAVIGAHKVVVKCPFTLAGRAGTGDGVGSSSSGVAPPAPKKGAEADCTLALKYEDVNKTPLKETVPAEGLVDFVVETTSN